MQVESKAIEHSFESEKNKKAFLYTAGICGILLILAIFYTWPLQIPPVPTVQDLIDINLGNDMEGMGDVQPLVKGERAPETQSIQSQQKSVRAADNPTRNIQADDNNDEEAAPVVKAEKPKEDAKDLNKETTAKVTKSVNPSPVINPNPAPPKPKLPLYKGGNGTGGNGAAEDNGYRNQGYKPGNGDAGSLMENAMLTVIRRAAEVVSASYVDFQAAGQFLSPQCRMTLMKTQKYMLT